MTKLLQPFSKFIVQKSIPFHIKVMDSFEKYRSSFSNSEIPEGTKIMSEKAFIETKSNEKSENFEKEKKNGKFIPFYKRSIESSKRGFISSKMQYHWMMLTMEFVRKFSEIKPTNDLLLKHIYQLDYTIMNPEFISKEWENDYKTLFSCFKNANINLSIIDSIEKYLRLMGIMKVNSIFNSKSHTFGLYLASSYINHSCDPNLELIFENQPNDSNQSLISFVTKRKIKKDEEITFNYLGKNSENLNPSFRKKLIELSFGFRCLCSICSEKK
ncbi:histone-lysine n-methyltransferase smyd [Anaeramoeba ignava]|uniref:Histone-lysine n-methyltransferase smyd n=1 Tax=Anaeramoeba ignava TaxID=1746090 RepID=A0A9Q0LMB4_ANAIG|nr:histone-lysine n-methyltransferase smyd [Anaeramoeba ignava]